MFRVLSFVLAIALLSFFVFRQNYSVRGQTSMITPVDGVYEFISELRSINSPRKSSSLRTSTDWLGRWQLQNGYYTRVLMKRQRTRFFDPKKLDDLGFESLTGSYEVRGDTILFSQECAFNPLDVGGTSLVTYTIDGDELTLIEKLHPRVESMIEGTVTTTLRRVK